MNILLKNIKPVFLEDKEVENSEIFLKEIIFEENKKYLIKANSGKGKTSLLNIIYGSLSNFEGNIEYNNNSKLFKQRIDSISYVFQDLKLFDELTVLENIYIKNDISNHKTESDIISLLEQVGLLHKKNILVKKMSLGQKQRIAVLRAICQEYKFLLLDEPFSHLDELNIKILSEIIKKDAEEKKASIIMVSLGSSYFFDYDKEYNL